MESNDNLMEPAPDKKNQNKWKIPDNLDNLRGKLVVISPKSTCIT